MYMNLGMVISGILGIRGHAQLEGYHNIIHVDIIVIYCNKYIVAVISKFKKGNHPILMILYKHELAIRK